MCPGRPTYPLTIPVAPFLSDTRRQQQRFPPWSHRGGQRNHPSHSQLPKMGALKTRAYLARFLVKLDVPGDIMQNDEVSVTYEKVRERGVWGRACVRAADLTRGNKRRRCGVVAWCLPRKHTQSCGRTARVCVVTCSRTTCGADACVRWLCILCFVVQQSVGRFQRGTQRGRGATEFWLFIGCRPKGWVISIDTSPELYSVTCNAYFAPLRSTVRLDPHPLTPRTLLKHTEECTGMGARNMEHELAC